MIKIQNVNDAAYKRFGKVITDIELGDLLQAMEATPCPDDVVYVASEAALEATKSAEKFQEIYYGKLPIQVGYCNGHNSLLNALRVSSLRRGKRSCYRSNRARWISC